MRVVVSGASRGLGLATSSSLVARSHRVWGFARTRTEGASELERTSGGAFSFTELDATDDERVQAHLVSTARAWGGLDALVANAAVGQDSLLAHTSAEQVARLLDVNVRAPVMLTRAFTRVVLRQGTVSRVVLIGSIGARQGYAGLSVYAATKGALESFARALATELRGRVLVNVVAPGFFASEMSSVLAAEQLTAVVRRTPSGSLTTPEQVAEVVAWLLEQDANINGSVLTVDGGASA